MCIIYIYIYIYICMYNVMYSASITRAQVSELVTSCFSGRVGFQEPVSDDRGAGSGWAAY